MSFAGISPGGFEVDVHTDKIPLFRYSPFDNHPVDRRRRAERRGFVAWPGRFRNARLLGGWRLAARLEGQREGWRRGGGQRQAGIRTAADELRGESGTGQRFGQVSVPRAWLSGLPDR